MKKKLSVILAAALLVCAMVLPASAAQETYCQTETIYTDFGPVDVETVITVYESLARSSTKSADIARTFRYDGSTIAVVTLYATFGYDGSSAWVVSASGSHTTYGGWSYSGENITTSGGTAYLTATLSHLLHRNVPVSISLTCSPTGQIS